MKVYSAVRCDKISPRSPTSSKQERRRRKMFSNNGDYALYITGEGSDSTSTSTPGQKSGEMSSSSLDVEARKRKQPLDAVDREDGKIKSRGDTHPNNSHMPASPRFNKSSSLLKARPWEYEMLITHSHQSTSNNGNDNQLSRTGSPSPRGTMAAKNSLGYMMKRSRKGECGSLHTLLHFLLFYSHMQHLLEYKVNYSSDGLICMETICYIRKRKAGRTWLCWI